MVKFGLLGVSTDFQELSEFARLAEELRFDAILLPEHHQQPLWASAPLIQLAALATQTSCIRLGTAVTVMALRHPVRLAEEVATLDNLSNGRLVLGIGLGYQPSDFAALGVPFHQRLSLLEEGLAVMRLAWARDGFSFTGRHYRLEGVSAYPKPVQRPGPPLWLAGWTREGVRRAARLGDAWLGDPILGLAAEKELAEEYRKAAREVGRKPQVVLMRQYALAESRAEARRLYSEMVATTWRYYWLNRSFNLDLEPHWRHIRRPEEITFDMAAPDRVIWGSPADCARQTRRWLAETGADYLAVAFTPPPDGHQRLLQTLRLFAERVMPEV